MSTEKIELKLKRHETFSIREGWLEKGIHYINKDGKNMSKENGTRVFGLGSNMIKSLRYWLTATKLVNFKGSNAELSELGELLLKYDPFLDDDFSWWLIHLNLVDNEKDAPVFNAIFNLDYTQFDKDLLADKVQDKLREFNYEEIKSISSLDSDITVFLKSYYSDDYPNPEDNNNCPLAKLNLFSKDSKRIYVRKMPVHNKLDFRIVYLSLIKCVNAKSDEKSISFNIEDLYTARNNPLKVLNISRSALFRYLEEMENNGYIELNKTAGLNVVYIDEIKDIEAITSSYYVKEE